MIQIKMLRDMNGMFKNHIYNISDGDAKKLVEHGCFKNSNGEAKLGTGDVAVYYSIDKPELHNTIAPLMNIPTQLSSERLLRVSDEKQPIDSKWPESNNTLENKPFSEWIISHEKYGVLCGGLNKLCVIDFDDATMQQNILDDGVLPPTFTVRTARKKLLHLYYYLDNDIKSGPIKNEENKTLADVQFERRQVIGPGSRIPSGQTYDVVNDIPITKISAEIIHKALDGYNFSKTQEVLQSVADGLTLDDFRPKFSDNSLQDIKNKLRISEVLREAGIPVKGSRGNTRCPFHNSVGGKCLSYDDSRDGGLWNCFNCGKGGDVFTLWMEVNHIDDFADAKRKLCEKLGIEDKYIPPPIIAPTNNALPDVQLPADNHTIANFSTDLAKYFKGGTSLFFKVDERAIVEVANYFDKQARQDIITFAAVPPGRLLNLIEERVNTFMLTRVKKQDVIVRKSANEQTIKLVSTNNSFIRSLFEIKRLLNYPMPFVDSVGNLIIPSRGYDERYQAFFTPNTPDLQLMPVSDAKDVLKDIISEFCFKDPYRDVTMAIAYIITPMCRGLYESSCARTPIFIIAANRERAGKDYLAGVRGNIYEGEARDDNPFVTGSREVNHEEWRKKFTTILKTGRRLIHSSNNRGKLDHPVLEQFSTSEKWTDRQLGGNIELDLNNEVDISLSANIGLEYTADLWYRARPIHLFYAEENPNARTYKRPNLHAYIRNNRGKILSAIYTLIKVWYDAGQPPSKTPFTSFPEWARVVGGIMQYHDMGDPCELIEDEEIGGDAETRSIKDMCRFMAEYMQHHPKAKNSDGEYVDGYTVSDLRGIISDAKSHDLIEGFNGWDFTDKADQVKFGILMKRFVNRIFNCRINISTNSNTPQWEIFSVKMVIARDNGRSTRIEYAFKTDKIITVLPERVEDKIHEEIVEESADELTRQVAQGDLLVKLLTENGEMAVDLLVRKYKIRDAIIIEFKNVGMIYESRPGFVSLV
jgi:hypothetical protein